MILSTFPWKRRQNARRKEDKLGHKLGHKFAFYLSSFCLHIVVFSLCRLYACWHCEKGSFSIFSFNHFIKKLSQYLTVNLSYYLAVKVSEYLTVNTSQWTSRNISLCDSRNFSLWTSVSPTRGTAFLLLGNLNIIVSHDTRLISLYHYCVWVKQGSNHILIKQIANSQCSSFSLF